MTHTYRTAATFMGAFAMTALLWLATLPAGTAANVAYFSVV